MNINLSVSINPNTLQYTDDIFIVDDTVKDYNLFISPFYAIESDILSIFMEDETAYLTQVSKLIFEQSIKIDDKLTTRIIADLGLSPQEAFRLKREYVICSAVYKFGRVFHKDFIKSVKKSKFLADLKVSLDIEKDTGMLTSLLNDAKNCMEEIEGLIGISTGFSSFVKGGSNPCNYTSYRQWYPSMGNNTPAVSIAAGKVSAFCQKYKIGVN